MKHTLIVALLLLFGAEQLFAQQVGIPSGEHGSPPEQLYGYRPPRPGQSPPWAQPCQQPQYEYQWVLVGYWVTTWPCGRVEHEPVYRRRLVRNY